jgi:hypothetical protein
MSIPGMSGAMVAGVVGAGELPDMSMPGMSGAMVAGVVGAGELPDMSIPGMSAGMLVGAGWLSDPTPAGTAATVTRVAAADSWPKVIMMGPPTAMAATVAPTDTTRIRRHQKASHVGRLWLVWLVRSPVLVIVVSAQSSRCQGAVGP